MDQNEIDKDSPVNYSLVSISGTTAPSRKVLRNQETLRFALRVWFSIGFSGFFFARRFLSSFLERPL